MEKKQHPVANKYSTPEKKNLQKKTVAKKNQPFFQNKINKKNYALKKKQEKTWLRKPPKKNLCLKIL